MKLHTAIRDFTNQYDREAISSIQSLNTEISRSFPKFLFEGVDVQKSADLFIEYLEGYAKFKTVETDQDSVDVKTILERTEDFLDHRTPGGSIPIIFDFKKLTVSEVPEVCTSFLESVKRVMSKIDSLTSDMKESGASNDEIGALTEMGDMYVSHLYPKLEKIMEYALSASGYNTKKWVDEIINKKREPKTTSVFV